MSDPLPLTQRVDEPTLKRQPGQPETIGPYRVLGVLGQGGMGVVYLAERDDGLFEQRVALKVLPAWAEPGDHGRFLRERQFLARMEHPNIARLLDGGLTPDGAPYFALEYVDGEPLGTHVARAGLDLPARIALFLKIGDAVHYAHQHLVIHRDLKPSNVLIDASGEPKLLDFGIAKAVDRESLNDTQTVTRLMTPAYAAPEQLLGEAVSTLTDVYTLGVILHELLIGERPHAARAGVLSEAQILSEPIALPSSRAGQVPGVPARALKGDLDLILLKALKREPARRYASVAAFSQDLRAWLNGRPISARPDSWRYRLGKLIARNRVASAVVAASVMAVLAGLVISLVLAERARTEAARAQAVQGFLLEMFAAADPDRRGAAQVTARELLDSAAREVNARFADDPVMASEVRLGVAGAYNRLGLNAPALALLAHPRRGAETAPHALERAIALKGVGRFDDARAAIDVAVARSRGAAQIYAQRERIALRIAKGELEQAETDLRALLPSVREPGLEVLLLLDLAQIEATTNRLSAAETSARRALERAESAFGSAHTRTADAAHALATILDAEGARVDADANYRRALGIYTARLGSAHAKVIAARDGYGFFLLRGGDAAGAEAEFRAALAEAERAYGPEHFTVGALKLSLSTLAAKRGDWAQAERDARTALAIQRRVYGPDSLEVLETLNVLATVLGNAERFSEANVLFAESLRVANTLEPDVRERKLSSIEHKAANLLRRQNRCAEAKPLFENVLKREDRPDSAFNLEPTLARLAECELALGEHAPALAHAERAYRLSESPSGLPANRSASLVAYARALRANGQTDAAEPIVRAALDSAQAQFGRDSPAWLEAAALDQ
jgi:eukaryotic-like serine/threonine-protein kinase